VSNKRFFAAALAAILTVGALAALLVGSGSAEPNATFKAALVSDVGRFNDKGFNQLQLQGLQRAKKQLGVQILTLESRAQSDYTPNMIRAVQQGSNIIIGAGFLLADSIKSVAAQFPNSRFAITDDFVSSQAGDFKGADVHNIEGLTYATQENSYLIGCMAALVLKLQGKPHVIGVVGGIQIPPVDTFLAGYKAGATKCVPGTKLKSGYSQSFTAPDLCKSVANNEIQAGAQVIFAVAGPCGNGALSAAKEKGRWGIGVDRDQSDLGSFILTSAVKRVDVGVYKAVQGARKSGGFKGGGNIVFNLKNNGVALGKISPKLPKAIKAKALAKVATLRKQIISGKLKPPTVFKP
jgi:basic membrane protein A